MYANAPAEVAAAKTMLEACTTWTALSGTIHYPSMSLGDSVSPDTLPAVLIEPVKNNPKILAPGVVVPGGTLQLLLTMKDSSGAAIEKTAREIADELITIPAGLPIISIDLGMCSMPEPGDRAAQAYDDQQANSQTAALRTIAIIITYGLT